MLYVPYNQVGEIKLLYGSARNILQKYYEELKALPSRKVNNRNNRCEICSKLTIKTSERCQAVTLWIKCFDKNTGDEMFDIPKVFCTSF